MFPISYVIMYKVGYLIFLYGIDNDGVPERSLPDWAIFILPIGCLISKFRTPM